MFQADYNALYDRLAHFAETMSARYFRRGYTESNRQDAIFTALAKFVDNSGFSEVNRELIYDPQIEDIEKWGRTLILNSLKDFRKTHKPDADPVQVDRDEYYGFHGYQIKEME